MTSSPDLEVLLANWRAEEDQRREKAWALHAQRKLDDGAYELGFAHALKAAGDGVRALLALAGDTSGGVEKIDKSSCADSSDAPRFAAAEDAQRKSEGPFDGR